MLVSLPATHLTVANSIKNTQFVTSLFFLSHVLLLIHDASHGSPMVRHQYLWSSVLWTEAAIVTSSFYKDINVWVFFPFTNCSFAHHIRWFCLNHFPHFFLLNLHSRLKIEAESHGHWSKISVKSQLSRRCVSTALGLCICPFCLSGPVSYPQPGEHWQ